MQLLAALVPQPLRALPPRERVDSLRPVFRYRLHLSDGTELGDATYAMQIVAGETIHFGVARFEVLRLVDLSDETGSPYDGMLEVEPV